MGRQLGGMMAQKAKQRLICMDDPTHDRLRLTSQYYGMSMSKILSGLVQAHLPEAQKLQQKMDANPLGVLRFELHDENPVPPPNLKKDKKDPPLTVDYGSVKKWWNDTVRHRLQKKKLLYLSERRKAWVRQRIMDNPNVLEQIAEEANHVSKWFLEAQNFGHFEWLFKSEGNLHKFLEGIYRDPSNIPQPTLEATWEPPAWFPEDWRTQPKFRKIAIETYHCPSELLV